MSDERLVEALRRGDPDAIQIVLCSASPYAHAVLRNCGITNEDLILDSIADATLKVLESPEKYRWERGRFIRFYSIVALRSAFSRLRKLNREVQAPDALVESIADRSHSSGLSDEDGRLISLISEAVNELPPLQRESLIGRSKGMSSEIIAARHGSTAASVDVSLHIAKKRVRDRLAAGEFDQSGPKGAAL